MTNRNFYLEWRDLVEDDTPDGANVFASKNANALDFYKQFYLQIQSDFLRTCRPGGQWIEDKKELKYMVTFTLDPCKLDIHLLENQNTIEKYICDVILRIPNISRAYYVKEHPDSNCHWHFILHSTGAIKKGHFSHYQNRHGKIFWSKSVSQIDDFSVKYMTKEGMLKVLKGQKPKIEKVE